MICLGGKEREGGEERGMEGEGGIYRGREEKGKEREGVSK